MTLSLNDLINLGHLRWHDHAGKSGWRVKVCMDTMAGMVDAECFCEKLRGEARRDPASIFEGRDGAESPLVLIDGRRWVPELLARIFALRWAKPGSFMELSGDLDEGRRAAVAAILAEQGKVMAEIRRLNRETMAIFEEQLRHREPKAVN